MHARLFQRGVFALIFLPGLVAMVGTLLSLFESEWWWVRMWDFPRYQLCAMALSSLLGCVIWMGWIRLEKKRRHWVVFVLLGLTALFQAYRIFPYTPLASEMSLATPASAQHEEDTISVMVCNVLMENREYGEVLSLVAERSPDVALFLETDEAWSLALDGLRARGYEPMANVPMANTYGMVLFSRLPMEEVEVRYLMQDDIPSVRAMIRLENGRRVRFYGLHPRPPAPSESKSSLPRDAELVKVAEEVRTAPEGLPVLVAGDMNDVAWSKTSRLFLEISQMLDPRRGRGLLNSFPTWMPVLRVPLDHIFHSPHFTVNSLERLQGVGSDHFPIMVTLTLREEEHGEENTLDVDREDFEDANEKLREAEESKRAGEFDPPHPGKDMSLD